MHNKSAITRSTRIFLFSLMQPLSRDVRRSITLIKHRFNNNDCSAGIIRNQTAIEHGRSLMFQKKTLSLSIAMIAALGASAAVVAQEDQVEEVVVTGIRGSLSQALDVKRNNTQIVDAIVAEDIGKFPDNNVIEAMQRITGVQVTNRGSGETSAISIRGLTDINTTVNGRNIFTASGLAVALQDVPASLIKQVDVYKTRSASQIENGIAGSVDIKTQRPFDFDGSKFVLAMRAINQEQ